MANMSPPARIMRRLGSSHRTSCSVTAAAGASAAFVAFAAFGAAVAAVAAITFGAQRASAAPARPILLDEPPRLFTFKLDDPAAPKLSLLRAFQNAEIERPGPLRRYLGGPWGQWRAEPWQTLSWSGSASGAEGESEGEGGQSLADGSALVHDHGTGRAARDEAASLAAWISGSERLFGFEPRSPSSGDRLRLTPDASVAWLKRLDPEWSPDAIVSTGSSFASNGFDALWAAPVKPVPNWRCRRRPVTFMRYGGEIASFELVRCDGAVAPDAVDRLSIMARPPEAKGPGPGELLPDEPAEGAWEKGEWLPQIRLVNPRLLWVLQRVADAFPWRSIYIYSGYRPKASDARRGSHHSLHSEARAMDISVMGVSNVSLFELCRTLEDVGCGYYPNSKFVHVDVRRPGTGHALWIDASGPGEPALYVDSWPGVMMSGAMAWDGKRMAEIEREEAEQRERPNRALPSTVCSDGPEADRHSR